MTATAALKWLYAPEGPIGLAPVAWLKDTRSWRRYYRTNHDGSANQNYARAEMACPPDLQVEVIRVDGRWDAFPDISTRISTRNVWRGPC